MYLVRGCLNAPGMNNIAAKQTSWVMITGKGERLRESMLKLVYFLKTRLCHLADGMLLNNHEQPWKEELSARM